MMVKEQPVWGSPFDSKRESWVTEKTSPALELSTGQELAVRILLGEAVDNSIDILKEA